MKHRLNLKKCKLKSRGIHTPTQGRASTSRMRTAISRGQWQPLIGAHLPGKPVRLMNGKIRVSKTPYCRGECKAVYQVPAPHNTCRSCWLGTAQQFYHGMRGEGGSRVTSKFLQEAHIHHPTAWPLPHACAQPNQGQWQPWTWHIRRSVTAENPCFFFVFQAPPATDPVVVQWLVEWPNDITILNRAGVQWLSRATPEGGFTTIAQELNLAPRKRSPPNGAPEQSGVQGLL